MRARGNAPVANLTLETPSMRRHLAEAKSLAETAKVLLLHESERLMSDMARLTAADEKMSREEIAEYGLNKRASSSSASRRWTTASSPPAPLRR